jgi:thiosulfate dehydrogenase (quinone) large subunit
MAIREIMGLDGSLPTAEPARTEPQFGAIITARATKFLAVFRVVLGFEFLWAFADKTFGLGYATPAARAWINGGSPTKGFLSRVAVGPFESTFHTIAGAAWADWLFMAGLLGIGIALVFGIGLRIAAVSGTLMMLGMWAAEWPLDKLTSAGEPSMSTNPIVDYHIIYALALIALAQSLPRPQVWPA